MADEMGRTTGIPLMIDVVPGGPGPSVDEARLEALGFAAALYPDVLLDLATTAMSAGLERLAGRPAGTGPVPAVSDVVGLREWAELGRRYDSDSGHPAGIGPS